MSNYACLYTIDFQSHRKSNIHRLHLNYVQLYETLHLEIAAHFHKVTETTGHPTETGHPTIYKDQVGCIYWLISRSKLSISCMCKTCYIKLKLDVFIGI